MRTIFCPSSLNGLQAEMQILSTLLLLRAAPIKDIEPCRQLKTKGILKNLCLEECRLFLSGLENIKEIFTKFIEGPVVRNGL